MGGPDFYAVAFVPRNAGDMRCEGSVAPGFFLVSLLVGIGCGDRYINRRHGRRRGRYERIRKDLRVTTPTRKLLSGRRHIGGHFDQGARNMASASAAFVDRQSMRRRRVCFHAIVLVASSVSGRI